jgi:hypothetical protein
MNEQSNRTTLSTADVAAVADRQSPDQDDGLKNADARDVRTQPAASPAAAAGGRNTSAQPTPLFSTDETQTFRSRWDDIQTGFVDEPRTAVEQADGLVAEAMKRLAEMFADERAELEQQWDRGDDISTEDLRVALRRYRSFFARLLAV